MAAQRHGNKQQRWWIIGAILFVVAAAGCGEEQGTGTGAGAASAQPLKYAAPTPLASGSQADCGKAAEQTSGEKARIAYMPPATEFNYYIAIGKGIEARAKELGVDTFQLAPQSGNDINGQMGMIQDVISQGVNAIILSTHDENAAAPLVKRAVDQGIAVVIVNSDIPNFPTAVHGVVGYKQRAGTRKLGQYAIELVKGKPTVVGILEGAPGYHSKERVGGFLDAIKSAPNFKVVASLNGNWNVDGGNKAATDMLQAHPDIQTIFAANDYEILGAAKAADSLNKKGLILLGNDGDTNAGLEPIASGQVTATVNTTPFEMGRTVLQVTMDCLNRKYNGGYVETPVQITTKSNVGQFLCHPERLYPKPSKTYPCSS
jgi:ribose transport system substrate-binding protein